jgi:hypothetical protein
MAMSIDAPVANGDSAALTTHPSLIRNHCPSNCSSPELEFPLTHSKQTIASVSNRNFSRVISRAFLTLFSRGNHAH